MRTVFRIKSVKSLVDCCQAFVGVFFREFGIVFGVCGGNEAVAKGYAVVVVAFGVIKKRYISLVVVGSGFEVAF